MHKHQSAFVSLIIHFVHLINTWIVELIKLCDSVQGFLQHRFQYQFSKMRNTSSHHTPKDRQTDRQLCLSTIHLLDSNKQDVPGDTDIDMAFRCVRLTKKSVY